MNRNFESAEDSETVKDLAPSTPAPQVEKCAHAPEIPEDLKEMYDCCVKLMETREDYGFLPSTPFVLIERIALAESALARERESRKQAEAALRDIHDLLFSDEATPKDVDEAFTIACAALSKPVQEPAERERGK